MAEEEARLEREEAAAAASGRLAGLRSWLAGAMGTEGDNHSPETRTPRQRRMLAASRAEARLDAQLGPPPPAPQQPKGVYLHGTVGSGKSLVLDLFSAAVRHAGGVPHHRRLHFNSAMLELHRRGAWWHCACAYAAAGPARPAALLPLLSPLR